MSVDCAKGPRFGGYDIGLDCAKGLRFGGYDVGSDCATGSDPNMTMIGIASNYHGRKCHLKKISWYDAAKGIVTL